MLNIIQRKVQVIGTLAAEALRREAAATPKPGLVDKENCGAHQDMDYPLFLASADALAGYFARCAELGAAYGQRRLKGEVSDAEEGMTESGCSDGFAAYIRELRTAGLDGETAMFAASRGVNTHKGLVFSMGILCGSIAYLSAKHQIPMKEISRASLQKQCAETASALLGEVNPEDTHGGRVYRKAGVGGIRKEALSGFDGAFKVGLPALEQSEARGFSQNEAMIYALLSLMAVTEDSNAAHRGGAEGLAFIQRRAKELLISADLTGEGGMSRVRAFDAECIHRNISPGGSADLLALSAMLFMIYNGEEL